MSESQKSVSSHVEDPLQLVKNKKQERVWELNTRNGEFNTRENRLVSLSLCIITVLRMYFWSHNRILGFATKIEISHSCLMHSLSPSLQHAHNQYERGLIQHPSRLSGCPQSTQKMNPVRPETLILCPPLQSPLEGVPQGRERVPRQLGGYLHVHLHCPTPCH